ncbi:hypothetical protein [Nocardioides conyzicola]|uniref:Right-handed parallel beta-helix repeat-containing protein n=1 Tax=Nocardioides conyzicola TaxID=1651781 RepID=A0ABP8XP01_9ACTN
MPHPTPRRRPLPTFRIRRSAAAALATVAAITVLPTALTVAPASARTAVAAAQAPAAAPATAHRKAGAAWPGKHNTGVPAGLKLRAYTGSCTITRPTTIIGVDATRRCDAILVRAPGVEIRRSLLPRVDATDGGDSAVTLIRSTVDGGRWSDGAIWGYNITARRVEVTGAQHSFHCAGNCRVIRSWLHAQYNPAGESYHNNAFISNGGSRMVLRHNRLACTPQVNSTDGGCTADLSLFGDFDPIRHVRVIHNLFVANSTGISYCMHAGYNPDKPHGDDPSYVVVKDNVFQRGTNRKCGVWGPVTSFRRSGVGNEWTGNRWEDGRVVRSQ